MSAFTTARWIWTSDAGDNACTLFAQNLALPEPGEPVHDDPQW